MLAICAEEFYNGDQVAKMTQYIHQLKEWPNFVFDTQHLTNRLATVRFNQGHLLGRMGALGFELRQEAELGVLTEDVVKSSSIEGETLDAEQVRSSIARRLGMDAGGLRAPDRNVEGVVTMMLDATQRYEQPLTAQRLWGWHASLFPTGWSGLRRIAVGQWRDDAEGPMQVVSGKQGQHVHFEAPAADKIHEEMTSFLDWFDGPGDTDWVVRAALAHLWFVTIHPFDDGNGRMARAIADMALARSEKSAQRFYSMSAQIQRERGEYYDAVEQAQKAVLDVTEWIDWFLACLDRAIEGARTDLAVVLKKARFWESINGQALNERQRRVLNRLVDGFEGKLTKSKWTKLTGCSEPTAFRDIQDLVDRGILVRNEEGGRSTNYSLVMPSED